MKSGRSRKTNLVSIGSVLSSSQKKTQHAFTTSKLRKEWPHIVGELLGNQTRPKKIDRNLLWVSVENSALNYELSLMKPQILEKIFDVTGTKYKDIKFIHENVIASQGSSLEPSRQKFIRTPAGEGESLETILERVKTLSMNLQNKKPG